VLFLYGEMMKRVIAALSLIVLAVTTAAPASITGVAGGSAAPGTTLGPYAMTPFPLDDSPLSQAVTSVASPLGGAIDFDIPMAHFRIGDGWTTWSNGYTGDVYFTNGQTGVTMTLPAQTAAFYFYAEPNPWDPYTIVATAQDGTQISQTVNGYAGAAYYGFYGTGGTYISSITVTTPQSIDFAVGEFGIAKCSWPPAVPAPAGILLVTVGSVLVGHLRGRKWL
jgi:hypothetical protein